MPSTTAWFCDEHTAALDAGAGTLPVSWASRALYLGEVGVGNWLGVVNEARYPLRGERAAGLRADRVEAVRDVLPASFVSLGAGDGLADLDLLRPRLSHTDASRARALAYCPVDLSRALLEVAIRNVGPHLPVPLAIQCDFEEQQAFLAGVVDRHVRRPILFSLLGGTIGNLDCGEERFFSGFRGMLAPGDALLLDVPLAGPAWTPAGEPRLQPDAYSNAFRRFVLDGLARAEGATAPPPENPELLAERFAANIELQHRPDPRTGAEVVVVSARETARTLLTFCRYRWEGMLVWLREQGFSVTFSKSSLRSAEDRFGMGVVLLRRD